MRTGGFSASDAVNSTCFFDADVQPFGVDIDNAGMALSTADMKDISTYLAAGWDISEESDNDYSTTWYISSGASYPMLTAFRTERPDTRVYGKYFYLHDRLGSVRQVIDSNANALCLYTYDPYGRLLESDCDSVVDNNWLFTGQYYDQEIDQYYLRARQYSPTSARFTGCDPVLGKYNNPLTLHQ